MLPPGATIIPVDEAKKLLAERIELNWLSEIRRLTESKSDDAARLVNDLELEINSEWERAQKAEAELAELKNHPRVVWPSVEEFAALFQKTEGPSAEEHATRLRKKLIDYVSLASRSSEDAYRERDQCVALIAHLAAALGYTVGIGEHDPKDRAWLPEWRTIIYIDLPTGQVSWHIREDERAWFADLPPYTKPWDKHSVTEKYRRVLEYDPHHAWPSGKDWNDAG